MKSTHQASVDSLWMHLQMFLRPLATSTSFLQEFIQRSKEFKTILMHTMAYKLGTLHADDTQKSILRVLDALRAYEGTPESIKSLALTEYELDVFKELRTFCDDVPLCDELMNPAKLKYSQLAEILEETVYLPRIGSQIDFGQTKETQPDLLKR
jgi:hypothetical protein